MTIIHCDCAVLAVRISISSLCKETKLILEDTVYINMLISETEQ